jgi:HlyD family secretion protein
MSQDPLDRLRISSQQKQRRGSATVWIVVVALLTIGVAVYFALPRSGDNIRSTVKAEPRKPGSNPGVSTASAPGTNTAAPAPAAAGGSARVEGTVLTVTGYIVARERIEISPRFMGIVNWIGVRKGDSVTNGQVVVRLDDSEYQARLAENDGQLAVARVAVDRARMDLKRAEGLVASQVEMQKFLDDARLAMASAEAMVKQVEGGRRLLQTWIDWCVIRSPVNGVVLEKLVDANELVTPQTFGGGRGPSTSLLAVADLRDLQVEIDLGESDLAKVAIGQRCVVSPEAYGDRKYEGEVVEIAPEASRQKGTLQVKVQIRNPDRYLTPELSARVDFVGVK